jgi:hypothetical protein
MPVASGVGLLMQSFHTSSVTFPLEATKYRKMLAIMDDVRVINQLLGDLATFIWPNLRPHGTLATEKRFLRKQLAPYRERKLKPRRPDTPFRVTFELALFAKCHNQSPSHAAPRQNEQRENTTV